MIYYNVVFVYSDFSYDKWATDRAHDPDMSLPPDLLAKLLEETNIQGYLLEPQCEYMAGWTTGKKKFQWKTIIPMNK